MSKTCNHKHRFDKRFTDLPSYQGSSERHRCSGCAFELGFTEGLKRQTLLNVDFNQLPYSQAGEVRHKSVHTAFALGYCEGVKYSYLSEDGLKQPVVATR